MIEVKYPATTKHWICHNADGSVMHTGTTEANQVTTTGQPVLDAFDSEEDLVTAIAGKDVTIFPPIPNEGEPCEYLKIYRYGDEKVKCLQGHTRMHYTPEETPALWLIIPTVTEGYPAWVQPTGAHDTYQIGDRVTFNGNNYESLINANVWSPTAYPAGWKLI